jgi:hypothetical protein
MRRVDLIMLYVAKIFLESTSAGSLQLEWWRYLDFWARKFDQSINLLDTVTTQCGVTGQSLINSWFRYSNCYNSDYWPNLLPCWLNGITDRYRYIR